MTKRRSTTDDVSWRAGRPALQLHRISKTFGDVRVLKDISVDLARGKVIALMGENGSGKSTLIKILSGFYSADPGGDIEVGGNVLDSPVVPAAAHAAGLRFVHQDLGLVEALSIADNACFATGYGTLSGGRIRTKATTERVSRILGRLDLDWDPWAKVSSLSPAQRTMLAIARVLDDEFSEDSPRLLVLDEPTASLPATEVGQVFKAIGKVTAAGGTVLYVSHRIDEILDIADDMIVLRDGRMVAHQPVEGLTHEDVVALLLGRALERVQSRSEAESAQVEESSDVLLKLRGLAGRIVGPIDLDVKRGEIVGIGGLSGCGRSELARLIAGAQQASEGSMTLDGASYAPAEPGEAIRAKVSYVPEDRRNHGCILGLSLQSNLTMLDLSSFSSRFRLDRKKERKEVEALIERFDIRPADRNRPMAKFSGGNQQKAVLAKALRIDPKIVVLDEPTQGIDIGAKTEISTLILDLARGGTTVILASSEHAELAALCDRLVILDRGRVKTVLDHDVITADEITLLTFGSIDSAQLTASADGSHA